MPKIASIATATLTLLVSGTVVATGLDASNAQPLTGEAAFGGWQQDKPGERRLLTPQDLPPIGKSTPSFAEVVPMPPDAKPRVPAGLSVEMVASGLTPARAPSEWRRTATCSSPTAPPTPCASCASRPGARSRPKTKSSPAGLTQPYGIAFYPLGPNPEWVYVANSDSVVRFPYKNGDLKATGKAENDRRTYSVGASLDARHRLLARRQDDVALGRLRIERRARHVHHEPFVKAASRPGSRPSRSARPGTPRSAAPTSSPSIRTARTRRSSPPACATAPA